MLLIAEKIGNTYCVAFYLLCVTSHYVGIAVLHLCQNIQTVLLIH